MGSLIMFGIKSFAQAAAPAAAGCAAALVAGIGLKAAGKGIKREIDKRADRG